MREITNTQDGCAYSMNTADSLADYHRVDSVSEVPDEYVGEPIQIPSFDILSTSQPENEHVTDSRASLNSSDPFSDPKNAKAVAELSEFCNAWIKEMREDMTEMRLNLELDSAIPQIPKNISPNNSDDIT